MYCYLELLFSNWFFGSREFVCGHFQSEVVRTVRKCALVVYSSRPGYCDFTSSFFGHKLVYSVYIILCTSAWSWSWKLRFSLARLYNILSIARLRLIRRLKYFATWAIRCFSVTNESECSIFSTNPRVARTINSAERKHFFQLKLVLCFECVQGMAQGDSISICWTKTGKLLASLQSCALTR